MGPTMLSPRQHHCLAKLNGSSAFMAGSDSQQADTWVYNWQTGVWSGLPDLLFGVERPACVLYQDDQGKSKILVAGKNDWK